MKLISRLCLAAAFAALAPGARAQTDSAAGPMPAAAAGSGWKMDMSRELALWAGRAQAIDLAGFQGPLPLGVRINLKLLPDGKFKLLVPLKSPPKPGSFGGAPVFTVPKDGVYRITAGSAVWIEVADTQASATVRSSGFEMNPHAAMRKCVRFPLRARVRYALQLSGASRPEAGILLTADAR